MTIFYLIRHAEAEGNLYRRIHGQLNSMITPTGMKQIAALSKRFSEIPIDVCYSSDLLRTRTTAQAICVPKGLELIPEPAFRELQVGVWEDLTFGYLNAFLPEQMECFGADPAHWKVEGSEPFSVYSRRFIDAMNRIAVEQDGKTVAVFSHAAVMRGVIMTLFPDVQVLPSDNTCVTKLVYRDGEYELIYQNDNSHLMPEISTGARNRAMGEGFSKTDNLFWFREGFTKLEGLDGTETGLSFTVMAGEKEAGILCLQEKENQTGEVTYMGLLSHWRGRGRSVQLLGQAVFTFRKKGLKWLALQLPKDGSLDSLCRTMAWEPEEGGLCRMSLEPTLHPFLCTAGKPAVG